LKHSQYLYFFDIDNEYVGYFYLSVVLYLFPIEKKEETALIKDFKELQQL